LNNEWHANHVMPPNPTRDQKIAWHAEHAVACGCRPVPADLMSDVEAMARRKHRRPDQPHRAGGAASRDAHAPSSPH